MRSIRRAIEALRSRPREPARLRCTRRDRHSAWETGLRASWRCGANELRCTVGSEWLRFGIERWRRAGPVRELHQRISLFTLRVWARARRAQPGRADEHQEHMRDPRCGQACQRSSPFGAQRCARSFHDRSAARTLARCRGLSSCMSFHTFAAYRSQVRPLSLASFIDFSRSVQESARGLLLPFPGSSMLPVNQETRQCVL
jgi:hypothetical protein